MSVIGLFQKITVITDDWPFAKVLQIGHSGSGGPRASQEFCRVFLLCFVSSLQVISGEDMDGKLNETNVTLISKDALFAFYFTKKAAEMSYGRRGMQGGSSVFSHLQSKTK